MSAHESGTDFIRDWQDNAARLAGTYDATQEHDNCGVGMVAALDGKPRRAVVQAGIDALKAVWHRGAVDADGKTGDGAGIHIEIPQDFFAEAVQSSGQGGDTGRMAVGMVFLPKTDLGAQERCRTIVETEILNLGYRILGWRQVPINVGCIGEKANATRPEIEQIMIRGGPMGGDVDVADFERDLYVIRRRIEKQAIAAQIAEFYICSLSCRSIIYKGMFLAASLTDFYPDLLDPRFISRFAIYHQRYSTNTFPTWKLAQPFRMLAHNGEINTVAGNVNWMKSHETRLASGPLDHFIEDVKPVVQAGGSDTASLDNVFELMVRAGRDAPMTKTLLIPASVGQDATMPQAHRDMILYCNAVMEPWDGPAAIAATDGRWVIGGLDRNGLRPLRYTITADHLLVVGSETGMVKFAESEIIAKGRVGPGQCIGVDLDEARFYADAELKDMLAARQDFGAWVRRITKLDRIVKTDAPEPVHYDPAELRRRQLAVGTTLEELEMILHPMVEDSAEAVGSMGDDTPVAVLSERYRGLHHYFRQGFSQVTNPPIDSLRETRVMTLKTRLGNLGNVLDEDSSQCDLLQLDSPVLSNAEFDAMTATMGAAACRVDCTFAVGRRGGRVALRAGAHPARGGGGRARRLRPRDPYRRGADRRARPDPNDPGHRRGPHAPGPAIAPHLHQPERTQRGVHGHALLRRADRRRRHDRQRLPGAGGHRRPAPARAVQQGHAQGGGAALQEGRGQGPAEDHVQDGHLGHQQLPRRLQLRGHRAVPRAGGRVLPGDAVPHQRHRVAGHRAQGAGAAPGGLGRRRGAAGGRRL